MPRVNKDVELTKFIGKFFSFESLEVVNPDENVSNFGYHIKCNCPDHTEALISRMAIARKIKLNSGCQRCRNHNVEILSAVKDNRISGDYKIVEWVSNAPDFLVKCSCQRCGEFVTLSWDDFNKGSKCTKPVKPVNKPVNTEPKFISVSQAPAPQVLNAAIVAKEPLYKVYTDMILSVAKSYVCVDWRVGKNQYSGYAAFKAWAAKLGVTNSTNGVGELKVVSTNSEDYNPKTCMLIDMRYSKHYTKFTKMNIIP